MIFAPRQDNRTAARPAFQKRFETENAVATDRTLRDHDEAAQAETAPGHPIEFGRDAGAKNGKFLGIKLPW